MFGNVKEKAKAAAGKFKTGVTDMAHSAEDRVHSELQTGGKKRRRGRKSKKRRKTHRRTTKHRRRTHKRRKRGRR